MSYLTSLSSFDLQPQSLILFSRHEYPSPQHMTILMNTVCHSQLIHSFIYDQHQVFGSFSIFELFSTHLLYCGSLRPLLISHLFFFQAPYFTFMQNCWPYITHVNSHFQLCGGDLLPCSNSPHALHLSHSHSVLAVTAASHLPLALTLSPRCVNSLTVSISSHDFFLLTSSRRKSCDEVETA